MSRNDSPSDGRILSLLFAFTVLFILVFGFGVFVGKKLGRQELKITKRFDQPETQPTSSPIEGSNEPGSGVIAASPSPDIPEEAVENQPPAASPPPGETNNTKAKTDVVKDVTPEKTVSPASAVLDKRLAEITEQIRKEKEAADSMRKRTAAGTTFPSVDPKGLYTVQIGSFQDQKQANSLAGSLRAKGYPVFIKSMTTPDNDNWYRVRVGTFSDVETAKAYGESFKNLEPSVKLVFITVNN
ncbi:MAG: SPOR domain-containing protein [Thermodesulfobacteriota bacterium]